MKKADTERALILLREAMDILFKELWSSRQQKAKVIKKRRQNIREQDSIVHALKAASALQYVRPIRKPRGTKRS